MASTQSDKLYLQTSKLITYQTLMSRCTHKIKETTRHSPLVRTPNGISHQ